MRLGMGIFTQFINAQTFSQITGCQLVQKSAGVAKGQGAAKGPGLAKGAGAKPATFREPVAEPDLSRQRTVEAVAGGGEAVEEGGEE